MGRFTQTGASGEGSAIIDSGNPQALTQIDIGNVTVATPKVREVYEDIPIFLQFAGQVMSGNPDATDPQVIRQFPIHWRPHQQYNLFELEYVTGIFWKLPIGVTVDITASW